jgi:carboxylesterase
MSYDDGTGKRKTKWRKRLVAVVCAVLGVILVNGGMGMASDKADDGAKRDPETGVLYGAEELWLGPEDSPGAVLFVHGFVGAGNNFCDLPEQVAEAGWRVRVIRLPGHGTRARDLKGVTNDELIDDVVTELRALKEKHERVVLVGHSMGGALSTIVAAQEGADGIILGGGYFGVTHRWYYILPPETWIKIGKPIVRWVYKGQLFLQLNRKEVKDQVVSYTWIPTSAGVTLNELAAIANEAEVMENVNCPVLMLHAPGDVAASYEASVKAFEAMASEDKRLVTLDKSNHHIFWDYDKDLVDESVLEFLGTPGTPPANVE